MSLWKEKVLLLGEDEGESKKERPKRDRRETEERPTEGRHKRQTQETDTRGMNEGQLDICLSLSSLSGLTESSCHAFLVYLIRILFSLPLSKQTCTIHYIVLTLKTIVDIEAWDQIKSSCWSSRESKSYSSLESDWSSAMNCVLSSPLSSPCSSLVLVMIQFFMTRSSLHNEWHPQKNHKALTIHE